MVVEPYRPDEDWAKPITFIEERLVSKQVEGIAVPRIHKHLTNTYFGDLAMWIRLGGHWKKRTLYEGPHEGYIAYDIDEEAEAQRKEDEQFDPEEEIDLEEYGATLGPCLKRVLKAEYYFVAAVYPSEREATPNSLY